MAKKEAGITSIIGGVIVLVLLIQYASENPKVVNDVQYSIKEICGIDQKLFDALDNSVFETLDKKGKQIYNSFHMGKEVTKCDAWYFYKQLDEDNRKKIKLKEFACNINECLQN